MKDLKAKDFMKSDVFTIKDDTPVKEAIQLLIKAQVSNAAVTEGKKLVGFLSEADCLRFLSNEIYFAQPDTKISAIMTRHPVCVELETDIFAVASIFTQKQFRHLPVVEDGNLEGIISRRDVLKGMLEFHTKFEEEKAGTRFPPDLSKLMNHRFVIK